ncbi:threonylcarbamoyl-AMP synthase [Niabella ginsenosidivorans]|uniref:Threonylcarbamoyl-AMP synthase n=1 Tax=Niabella ginsenosidivorans TaxID=1176587 RepID=A0A1A9I7E2_9BACT|nr:L-threonylcarbamoyladenylate synthase [Niabella ginsenosidivorans]ANH83536.1 threonylcarbamoyl-AMP synthase [Niabella ginsenosidivorans]
MLIAIHPKDPQPRLIKQVADCLRSGGIIVYPTDTIYGLGCDIFQTKAIERIAWIKQVDPKKAQFSFVCANLSHLSDFAKQISNTTFRTMKEYLPGPYTFILGASKQVPKILHSKKDTVGIRVPDNKITRMLIEELGHPILSTTLPGELVEEYTDPEMIYNKYQNLVDIVVDGGIGGMIPSTVIDATGDTMVLVRQGAGEWEE